MARRSLSMRRRSSSARCAASCSSVAGTADRGGAPSRPRPARVGRAAPFGWVTRSTTTVTEDPTSRISRPARIDPLAMRNSPTAVHDPTAASALCPLVMARSPLGSPSRPRYARASTDVGDPAPPPRPPGTGCRQPPLGAARPRSVTSSRGRTAASQAEHVSATRATLRTALIQRNGNGDGDRRVLKEKGAMREVPGPHSPPHLPWIDRDEHIEWSEDEQQMLESHRDDQQACPALQGGLCPREPRPAEHLVRRGGSEQPSASSTARSSPSGFGHLLPQGGLPRRLSDP